MIRGSKDGVANVHNDRMKKNHREVHQALESFFFFKWSSISLMCHETCQRASKKVHNVWGVKRFSVGLQRETLSKKTTVYVLNCC